jgi:hypothetical protein
MVDRLLIAMRIFTQSTQITVIVANMYYISQYIFPDNSQILSSDPGITQFSPAGRLIERIESWFVFLSAER